jgi:two-component system sensor histidine kinase UhpB
LFAAEVVDRLSPVPADGGLAPVWEDHRILVIATGLVVLGQLLLIALLLVQRRDHRHAEDTIKAREAALRNSYDRIRQLAGRLIHAQEAARAGIARDLHDDICQQLTVVSLGVVALRRSSGNIEDPAIQQAFADLEYQTQVAFDGIRRLSHDLHPTSLRLLGLTPALKTYCLDVAERHDVKVAFTVDGDFRGLPLEIAISLYRIAQEAIRNGIAHAQAKKFSVTIRRDERHVELVVSDDGRGFDVEAMRHTAAGLGLVSMEERARSVGGEATVVSVPEQGTTVRVRCPAGVTGIGLADVSAGE